MALKLPDSAVPMGDFPVAKAVDIDFDDGENLQEKLDNGTLGGGGGSPEKQIKDWVSGSSYLEGDYIYHEGVIYRCLTSNSDVGFDETNWKQLTYGIDELSNASIMYCGIDELNKAKGTNISLDAGEDNTEKIMNVLAPKEIFSDWFRNDYGFNRFGIDLSMGDRINFLSIQKYNNDNDGVAIAITDKGKVLNRFMRNNILYNWEYDTTISQLETQVRDLFQSVSDGKTLVANAITGKGVSTSTTATFATMASNISKINTNGYKEETASWNKTSVGTNRIVFTFSADVYGVKQITPPSDASSHIVPETSTSMFTVNGKKLSLYVNGVGTWKVTAMVRNA